MECPGGVVEQGGVARDPRDVARDSRNMGVKWHGAAVPSRVEETASNSCDAGMWQERADLRHGDGPGKCHPCRQSIVAPRRR